MTDKNVQSPALDEDAKASLVALAEDLQLLLRFHDRELDGGFLNGLRQHSMDDWFRITSRTGPVAKAVHELEQAVKALPVRLDEKAFDNLATEYADIYLCHNYRIAPTGSVWLTEERLERQEPMFAVRAHYKKYDIEVPDWRLRSDDHIVHELQFIAFLCEQGTMQCACDAAHFLDQNMLNWIPEFADAIAERAREPIYIAVAKLTHVCLEELRDFLEAETGIARPVEELETRKNVVRLIDVDLQKPFMPGLNESW